jgi:hypothetical protein
MRGIGSVLFDWRCRLGAWELRLLFSVLAALFVGVGCDGGGERARLTAGSRPRQLSVTILSDSGDARVPLTREAIAHWNGEAARLQLGLRLDSGIVRPQLVPVATLESASRSMPRGGLSLLRLRAALSEVPGDIVIILSSAPLVSFGTSFGTGRTGVVVVRAADRWPLVLPNTVRNVVAHELGHVLGLQHNADSTTLMCGRPADCRPATFASPSPRIFPLTSEDDVQLRHRWR